MNAGSVDSGVKLCWTLGERRTIRNNSVTDVVS